MNPKRNKFKLNKYLKDQVVLDKYYKVESVI